MTHFNSWPSKSVEFPVIHVYQKHLPRTLECTKPLSLKRKAHPVKEGVSEGMQGQWETWLYLLGDQPEVNPAGGRKAQTGDVYQTSGQVAE